MGPFYKITNAQVMDLDDNDPASEVTEVTAPVRIPCWGMIQLTVQVVTFFKKSLQLNKLVAGSTLRTLLHGKIRPRLSKW